MHKTIWKRLSAAAFAALLTAVLLVGLLPANAAAAPAPGADNPGRKYRGPAATAGLDAKDRPALTKAQQKLSTELAQLVNPEALPQGTSRQDVLDKMRSRGQISTNRANRGASGGSGMLAYVYVELKPDTDPGKLAPYVAEVVNSDKKNAVATARVDVAGLEALASLDAVRSIRPVLKPVVRTGSKLSEGDAMHLANLVRANGFDGTGVKVGIISDGVRHIADSVASGNLPNNVTVLSDTVGGDEGTAMLEIVHDLAPGAQLYFHDCGENTIAFNQAIDALITAGCTIICDDIGWLDEPYFEDGDVAKHVRDVTAGNQIVYVSAAGNDAADHYQGVYCNNTSRNGFHDFSRGKDKTYKDLYVNIAPGGEVLVLLQWKEPFAAATSDYDLYLQNLDDPSHWLSSSTDRQATTRKPLEWIQYVNDTNESIDAAVCVAAFQAASPKELEVYIYSSPSYTNNIVARDSIYGHPAVPAAIACGAIDAATPGEIEYFSSCGPVTMLTETRQKPDVCGADGVSVTGAGDFPDQFYGTSAAAPHVAAIAALLLQKNPGMSASAVKSAILNGAVDLGASGYDTVYGKGRANAFKSVLGGSTVSFNTLGGSAVPNAYCLPNAKVTKPTAAVTRSIDTFSGVWCTDAAAKTPWDFATGTITADKTLYARWNIGTPAVPAGLKAASASYSSIKLTWSAANGATGYEVYRATSPSGSFARVATPTAAAYTDTGLQGGVTYYYRVRAVRLKEGVQKTGGYATASAAAVLAVPSAKASGKTYNSILVAWNICPGATGYEVWRAAASTGPYTRVSAATALSYTMPNATTGTNYYFKVRAYRQQSGGGILYGGYSAVCSAKAVLGMPAARAALASYTNIQVSWAAVPGATKYEVVRATAANGPYAALASTTATSLVNYGVTPNKLYYYKVRAVRVAGSVTAYSAYSAAASAKTLLTAPAARAGMASYSSIRVSWAAVSGATKYEVYRATSATGQYKLLGTSTSTQFTNTNVNADTTYYYKVRACRMDGSTTAYSAYSAVVSAKTYLAVPAVKAASAGYNSIRLTWGAVSGATKYEIYRAAGSGASTLLATTTAYTFTNSPVTPGTAYTFKVRACRVVGSQKIYTNFSAAVTAKAVPATPTAVKAARASATSVKVTWGAVAGATKYELWVANPGGAYSLVSPTVNTYYTDRKLVTGKTYYYKVRAYTLVGTTKVYGGFSAAVSARP